MSALSALRLGARIPTLISSPASYEAVQALARTVKLWAARRQINCNAVGFFGGLSWLLLSLKTAQLYPDLTPSQLLLRFFCLWSEWSWGTDVATPVLTESDICDEDSVTLPVDGIITIYGHITLDSTPL